MIEIIRYRQIPWLFALAGYCQWLILSFNGLGLVPTG